MQIQHMSYYPYPVLIIVTDEMITNNYGGLVYLQKKYKYLYTLLEGDKAHFQTKRLRYLYRKIFVYNVHIELLFVVSKLLTLIIVLH